MKIITKVLLGVAVILGVLGLILPRPSIVSNLAGTTRDQLTIDTNRLINGFAFTVSGDETSVAGLRNSSGTTIGGGTTIDLIRCNSVDVDPPSLTARATTSVDIALTGVSVNASATQVIWAYLTTPTSSLVIIDVSPSSTADNAMILLENNGSSTDNAGTIRANACLIDF